MADIFSNFGTVHIAAQDGNLLLHLVGPAKQPSHLKVDAWSKVLDDISIITFCAAAAQQRVEVYSINAEQQSTCLHNPKDRETGAQGTNITPMLVTMDKEDGQGANISEKYCLSIQSMAEDAYLGWPLPLPKLLASLAHLARRRLLRAHSCLD
jgi:hypothetical protein